MKKLLFAILFFTYSLSFSQTSFGVKGGLALVKQEVGKHIYFGDIETSYYFGGFAEYKLKNKFAIQGDISYIKFGGKGEYTLGDLNGHVPTSRTDIYKIEMHTITISLMAKYYIIEKLSIGTGGYFGLNIDDSYKYNKQKQNNKYFSKNNDLGLVGFIEFNVYKDIFIEAKYYLGLVDVNEDVASTADISAKNRALLFGVGYKF